MSAEIRIRPAKEADEAAIWRVIGPMIRAGETYPLPRDMSEADAIRYWRQPAYEAFVAERNGEIVGTYYLRANQQGGGAHVANCGYVVATAAEGRGVVRAMCLHSLQRAKERGFKSMQFNFVIERNARAVKLWQSCGFEIVGRLPQVFDHPRFGLVDAFVMVRKL